MNYIKVFTLVSPCSRVLTKSMIFVMFLITLGWGLGGCSDSSKDTAPSPAPHDTTAQQGLTPAQVAQAQLPDSHPNSNSTTGVPAMAQDITQSDIESLFNYGKPISPFSARTLDALQQCTQWAEPEAPDEMAQSWYRAATTLHAVKLKTAEQYRQMLILYEAAARRGHYRAALHLTVLYTTGGMVREGRFKPEPMKARLWINEGLRRGWPGALEWLSTALARGSAGYPRNEAQSLAYLQLAADLGVGLAQYELSLYYENDLNQIEKGDALLTCAGSQGTVSMASDKLDIIRSLRGFSEEALQLHQMAVMRGGEGGGNSAFSLSLAFSSSDPIQEELNTLPSSTREAAYLDLKAALNDGYDSQNIRQEGNKFLRFPRLNEVLPLPPTEVTEWQGIYSAMSPEDAAYYQNPPPPEFYIEQLRLTGYLVSDEYLGNALVLDD